MHYRHHFHAGNFADVFKHTLLCGLLQALNRKDKPWMYVDTHAGAGCYDLSAPNAERTAEWREGIGRLWAMSAAPEPLATMLDIVRKAQSAVVAEAESAPAPRWYPGSPLFAQALARAQDRIVVCEQVVEVALELKQALQADARAHIHLRNGYEAHALLPPREKRGLILIDPPFERVDEFDAVTGFLGQALARFAHGVYAVWYPLKNRHVAARFVRHAVRSGGRPVLNIEFDNGAHGEGQMRACGLLVINPPFQFEQEMDAALRCLVRELAQGPAARVRMEMLSVD